MMNTPDALSPSDSDSGPDSAVFSDETSPASSVSASSAPALPPHPPELALPAHPSETDLTPVEDVALVEAPDGIRSGEAAARLSLLAETVGVQKAWRGGGYVVISRRTVEEEVQIPVTLRHEEITMTRYFRDPNTPEAATEEATDAATFSSEFGENYGEGAIVMRLHEEVAEVVKTVRVAEEVEFARRIVSEETRLTGSARREELDIKNPQDIPVSGSQSSTS